MTPIKISMENEELLELLFAELCRNEKLDCCIMDNMIWCFSGKKYLAAVLAAFIFERREPWYLHKLLAKYYNYFDSEQQQSLMLKARFLLRNDSFCWGFFAGRDREERLAAALFNHLSECEELDLDGFISFRLVGYEEYLLAVLALAADDLLGEQEDHDYICILKDFLAGQKSCGTNLHIFLVEGCYRLLREQKNRLVPLEGGRLFGREEMIISCLLLLAPPSLTVHLSDERQSAKFVTSLQDIFAEKFHICHGCALCCRQ
jgi:putative sporulation protein YtxC